MKRPKKAITLKASILAEEIIPIKIFIPSLLENLAKENTDSVVLYQSLKAGAVQKIL